MQEHQKQQFVCMFQNIEHGAGDDDNHSLISAHDHYHCQYHYFAVTMFELQLTNDCQMILKNCHGVKLLLNSDCYCVELLLTRDCLSDELMVSYQKTVTFYKHLTSDSLKLLVDVCHFVELLTCDCQCIELLLTCDCGHCPCTGSMVTSGQVEVHTTTSTTAPGQVIIRPPI